MPGTGSSSRDMYMPSARKHYDEVFRTLQAYQVAINEAAIVSITDLKGNIIYVNQKFIEISKYTNEELVGKNHRVINSGYHESEFFRTMWQSIRSGKSWRGEIKNKAKDGSYYWVDTVITPIIDKKGEIYQYLSIRNLITVQKENEERLLNVQREIIKRERQLSDAQKVAKTGSWYLQISGDNRLEWSDETYHIFEIDKKYEMTYNAFIEMVHPDDRVMVVKAWQRAIKTGVYHIEHRIVTKNGEKWVSEHASFEFDKINNLKSALGTVQDITEKKKTENSLRESENIYKTLFESSPFAIAIVDKETLRFLTVNKTAVKLYGYSGKEFQKLSLYDIRIAEEHPHLKKQISLQRYVNDRTVRRHKKKNGEIIFAEPSVTSIIYKGRDVYLIAINDITARRKAEEELNLAEQLRQKDILEVEEKSRSAIGMELHDNVNQLLVAARLYLERIKISSADDKHLLKQALDILGTAVEEIRKLSSSLVTPILNNNGLKQSLRDLSESYRLMNVNIETDIQINEDTVAQGLQANIYRIVQEQLSNIIKHADATKVRITLLQYPEYMELVIADNGKGFNLKQTKKGIGITNIIFRAEAYGGQVSITTAINRGCKINIRFNN